MVKLRIKEVARSKNIRTAYQLQKLMQVPPATAARLWRADMTMIALSTIDSLCEALDCDVGDLIVRTRTRTKRMRNRTP